MRFLVPQFIEVEDKIFGPLTLKQGIYLLGGVGSTVVIWLKFGFVIAFLIGAPILILTFALAFVEIHGRPFIYVLSSAFFFVIKDKLYLWKKIPSKKRFTTSKENASKGDATEKKSAKVEMNQSKLKKLAWSLDTSNTFDKRKR